MNIIIFIPIGNFFRRGVKRQKNMFSYQDILTISPKPYLLNIKNNNHHTFSTRWSRQSCCTRWPRRSYRAVFPGRPRWSLRSIFTWDPDATWFTCKTRWSLLTLGTNATLKWKEKHCLFLLCNLFLFF